MIHRIHSATSKCNLRAIEIWSFNLTKILFDFRTWNILHETLIMLLLVYAFPVWKTAAWRLFKIPPSGLPQWKENYMGLQ